MLIAKCQAPFYQILYVKEFGRYVYRGQFKGKNESLIYNPSLTLDEAVKKARDYIRSNWVSDVAYAPPPPLRFV